MGQVGKVRGSGRRESRRSSKKITAEGEEKGGDR